MTVALRLRMLPRFPARITGTDGVKVVRVDGSPDLTVSLDFATLGDIAGIPDPATNFFAMYDTETGAYYRIPFQSMFDAAGVSAGYPTRAAAELANIPVPVHAIYLFGDATVGDGNGGLFIDTDNGSAITFVSADGRTWYLAPDINTNRLIDGAVTEDKLDPPVAALINGAMQKAQNLNDVADKASSRFNLKLPTLVADRTEMKALDTTKDTLAYLTQTGGHAGAFKWTAGNFSTHIAFDTQEGFYVKATAIAATAGAWVRQSDHITARMFGALGDGYADDNVALQKAWDFSGNYKIPCYMEGLEYNSSDAVYTSSNLSVFGQGAVLYAIAWPAIGGLVNNVRPVEAERMQSNIFFDRLITDGSKLPHAYVERSFPLQASNLLASQSDFSNAAWTKTGVTVTADSGTAPDGTLTADIIRENTANSIHAASATTTGAVANGDMLVYCVYAKTSTTNRNIAVVISGTAFGVAVSTAKLNVSTNAIISKSNDLYVVEIQRVNLSYSLITVAKRATAAGTYVCDVRLIDNTAAETYTGDGTSFAVVWGAYSNVAEVGNNTNLGPEFGWGASKVRINNCIARYARVGGGGGSGGGGFGGELGLKDIVFTNCIAEHCFRAARLAGNGVDTLPNGATEEAANIVFRDFTARKCGTAVFCHSVAHAGDDESNLKAFDGLFDGLYIEDCGNQAWAPVNYTTYPTIGGPQKSGVIALGGAQNIKFRNVRIALSTTYTTTDADWLGRVGYPDAAWNTGQGYFGAGLSGNVDSVIGGWGQNIQFHGIELDGAVTTGFKVHRVNVLGDLGTNAPTVAATETVRQFVVDEFRHVRGGALTYLFDAQSGVVDARFSVRITNFTQFATFGTGIVGPGATALANVYISFLGNTGIKTGGTTAEWNTFGNVPPASPQREFMLGGIEANGGYSATGTKKGVTLGTDSTYRWSTTGTASTTIAAFYNANGLGGNINLNNLTTSYVTSSDEKLKDFIGEYSWQEAFRVIKADPVRDWNWKDVGGYAVGWGAQTSYGVSPDLAVPGGWINAETGEPCEEGEPNAQYMPWGIDQSKRTPYLWAAVSHLIDEVQKLKKRR